MAQHSKRNVMIAIALLGSFFLAHTLIVENFIVTSTTTTAVDTIISTNTHETSEPQNQVKPTKALPDFSKINPIKARKAAFFDYLRPLIEQENQRLRQLNKQLNSLPNERIAELAEEYRVPNNTADLRAALAQRIDSLPASLVLAQAALESAWGSSRFARQGNNIFGEWCFTKGCGLVPRARNPGAKHEVRRFVSVQAAIANYMHNLNSHRAYKKFRQLRYAQRQAGQTLHGCLLAQGLRKYSEKRGAYILSLKRVIRKNALETERMTYCKKYHAKP